MPATIVMPRPFSHNGKCPTIAFPESVINFVSRLNIPKAYIFWYNINI